MAGFLNNGPIVATESEDSDIFTFLDIPLNDVDSSQRSLRSLDLPLNDVDSSQRSLRSSSQSKSPCSSERGPQSILKKNTSYTSLTSLGQSKKSTSYTSLTSLGQSSLKSNSCNSKPGRNICVEEPDNDSFHTANMKRVSSNVSFQTVNVREYDRTLGDNPSCMSGPPISLDWSYSQTTAVCINEYETNRPAKRGNSYPLRMNKFNREKMLKSNLGYSEEEIENAKKEKKKVQRSRSMTQFISPFWRIEHACQSVKRKFLRRSDKNKTGDDLSRSTRSAQSTISISKSADSSLTTAVTL